MENGVNEFVPPWLALACVAGVILFGIWIAIKGLK